MATWFCGLDLGQANDPSALVIVERREELGYDPATLRTTVTRPLTRNWWEREEAAKVTRTVTRADGTVGDVPDAKLLSYDVRHAARFPLGTPYPQIVKDVGALLNQAPLRDNVTLVIDGTGVGRAVCDLFTLEVDRHYATVKVIITGGTAVTTDESTGYWHVPKRDLVSVVQVALQNKRLRFPDPAKLPAVEALTHELSHFRVTISASGNESYAAWRERDHDDLVLSLAMAIWEGERSSGHTPRIRWL